MTDTITTDTVSYEPFFIDGNGNEVHIDDMVIWTAGSSVRSGRVLEIIFKLIDGESACMVKVKGRQSHVAPNNLTLIDSGTLEGKLRYLVAVSDGRIDGSAIEATAAEIEAMFAPEGEQDE